MTFDEMIEKLLNNEDYNTDGLSVDDVITLIEVLRFEYAPTVEMTKEQFEKLQHFKVNDENFANPLAQLILSLYEDVSGSYEMGMYDGLDVDDCNEIPIYVSAWQHPEIIKVVEQHG